MSFVSRRPGGFRSQVPCHHIGDPPSCSLWWSTAVSFLLGPLHLVRMHAAIACFSPAPHTCDRPGSAAQAQYRGEFDTWSLDTHWIGMDWVRMPYIMSLFG